MNFHYQLGRLAGFLLKPLFSSYRYTFHYEKPSDASLVFPDNKNAAPLIYASFHQHQFDVLAPFFDRNIVGLVSNSKDGSLMAGASEYYGYITVRGSSHRGGNQAFHQSLEYLEKGYSLGIMVDGPKGPIYKVKHGVITLSERSGALIVPISATPHHAIQFKNSWEKSYLPYPFSKIDIFIGEIKQYSLSELEEKLVELNQYCSAKSFSGATSVSG